MCRKVDPCRWRGINLSRSVAVACEGGARYFALAITISPSHGDFLLIERRQDDKKRRHSESRTKQL